MSSIVKEQVRRLDMTLHFQPAYSPEFNSIESLWHVVKQRVKRDLLLANPTKLNQEKFHLLIERCCESITYDEAVTCIVQTETTFLLSYRSYSVHK